jgi:hypothetical protein
MKMDELNFDNNGKQPVGFVMPSNPTDRKHIMDVVKEISASKTRMEAEKSFQKEAHADLFDKFKIPKRLMTRFANAYHSQNYSEVLAVDSDFETLVDTLLKTERND